MAIFDYTPLHAKTGHREPAAEADARRDLDPNNTRSDAAAGGGVAPASTS